jgi:N utilization substance protein B
MPSRHRSRQRALQVLFLLDVRKQPVEDALRSYYDSLCRESETEEKSTVRPDRFMEQLVAGAAAATEAIDRRISELSENWRIERMPVVDRNILRLAIYEMTEGLTPAVVVIDEALELARRFSGDDSVAFINGILDAVLRRAPGPAAEPHTA